MTLGKEGGTWLGMNKYGKISALLNLDKIEKRYFFESLYICKYYFAQK